MKKRVYQVLAVLFLVAIGVLAVTMTHRTVHADYYPVTPTFNYLTQSSHSLSSDERYVVYVGTQTVPNAPRITNLYRTDLTTGDTVALYTEGRLTGYGSPYISSQDEWVYFAARDTADENSTISLRRVPLLGGETQILISSPSQMGLQGKVSPNGRYLTAASDTGLYIIDNESTAVVTLPVGTEPLGFTPDSSTLVYMDNGSVQYRTLLYRVSVTGGAPTLFSNSPGLAFPTLTRDGAYVYGAQMTGHPGNAQFQWYRFSVEGNPSTTIGPSFATIAPPILSPDGQYLFLKAQRTSGPLTLYRLTIASSTLSTLFSSDTGLEFFVPEVGNRLVVVANPNSSTPSAAYSLDYRISSPPLLLTGHYVEDPFGLIENPLFSLDGTLFYYLEPGDDTDTFQLNRVPLDGSTAPQPLTPPTITAYWLTPEEDGAFFTERLSGNDYYRSELNYTTFSNGAIDTLFRPIDDDVQVKLEGVRPLSGHRVLYEYWKKKDAYPASDTKVSLQIGTLQPTARFTTRYQPVSMAEGASRTITIEMLPVPTEPVTVSYSVISGTATLGQDMVLSPASVVFAPGQPTQTLTVTVLSDSHVETLERFTLALSDATAADPLTTTVTLASNVQAITEGPLVFDAENPLEAVATTQAGDVVVFSQQTPEGEALFSYNLRTHTTTRLDLVTVRHDHAPLITPDNQSVIYATLNDLRRAPLEGGDVDSLLLLNGCDVNLQLAANGQYALIHLHECAQQDRLVRLDLATNAVSTLATAPGGGNLSFATLGPDGTLVYAVTQGNTGTLYRRPITDGDPELLTTQTMDGRFIAYSFRYNSAYYSDGTTLYRWQPGVVPQLLGNDANDHIELAPRGDYLFYAYRYPSPDSDLCAIYCYETYIIRGDGNGKRPIARFNQWRFSPDGATVALGDTEVTIFSLNGPLSQYPQTSFGRVYSPLPGNARLYGQVTIPGYEVSYHEQNAVWAADLRDGPGGQNPMSTMYIDPNGVTFHTVTGGDILYFSDDGVLYVTGNFAPEMSIAPPPPLVAEGTTLTVTVSLFSASPYTITADYSLTGGTATEGQDFTFTPGTLTFAPFERTKTFTVELLDDGVTESVETAIFTLSNITGGTAGDQTTYTLRIADEVYEQQLPILLR